MPTLPPRAADPTEPEIHRHRQMAESFGLDPERYDRARPRYPDAMIDAIMAASAGPEVLDVGCGTGIAARQFQAAGCWVVGVDVDERMAAFARSRGLEVEVARFEGWDSAGREFDAVIAGRTWHWVEPLSGATKAAEVLRPGGRLAVFWNMFQPTARWRRPSRRSTAGSCPTCRSAPGRRPLPTPGRHFSRGRPRASAPPAPSATRSSGGSSGNGATREPSGSTSCPRPAGMVGLPAPQLNALLAGTGAAIDALGGLPCVDTVP